jgi:outer membrane protein OmpA-like peptidoglycan-associated protein
VTTLAVRIAALRHARHLGKLDAAGLAAGLAAALQAPPHAGPWLTGTYDGDLIAGDSPEHRGGVLTTLRRAAVPPTPTLQDLPWLADQVRDVRLASSPTEALPADLHDVRLHDVVVLHAEGDRLRVRGILWGRVVLGAQDLLPVLSIERQAREPETPQVAMADDGLTVYGPDTRAVEGTGHVEGSGASLGCAALGCLGVPAVTAIGIALGLVGGAGAVATWLGGVALAWVVHHHLPLARQLGGRDGCLGSVGVLALASLTTATVAWLVGADPCGLRPVWWLLPALLPVFAGVMVRWRAAFLLAAAAWSYGLWLWSAVPEAACAVDAEAVSEHLPIVLAWQETRDHFEEATAHDPDADLLEDATDIGGDRRLSLDSALRDPDAWACDLPVHLSGAVLFEDGSDAFAEDADPHLRRLARLLRRVEGLVLVEGHGAQAGLSGVRARAVTTWLIEIGGVADDRLTPQGLGDDGPVVHDDALSHYNRRIDVVRTCP